MSKFLKNRKFILLFALIVLVITSSGVYLWLSVGRNAPETFDGQRAFEDVRFQIDLGPRIPGSEAHRKIIDWMVSELEGQGWQTKIQETSMMSHPVKNVIATRLGNEAENSPWIIIGAHYDSRLYADQDPDPTKRSQPVPGANDGASGVAVLLELARSLPPDIPANVWFVFFDAEDNGNISGWDWILGSQAFVGQLEGKPDAALIVDMIGDSDLNIYIEQNSDAALTAQIWAQAAELGYASSFIPIPRYSILDDHTSFLRAGIPAVDIIDFDYPYWHTTSDTLDKVSPQSLQIVGEVLTAWLVAFR